MKNILTGLVLLLLIALGVVYWAPSESVPTEERKVAATIFPVYDIARQIAGEEFTVELLLPPGASPHTFEPQPSSLVALQHSETLFAIGHGLDDWALEIAAGIDIEVTIVDGGIALRESDEDEDEEDHHDDESHGHDHGPEDPHYWLSREGAKSIARNIADVLSGHDPENAVLYEDRTVVFASKIDELYQEYDDQVSGLSAEPIVALHDAWYYFADDINFDIVGTFEPSAGKEPSPQYLKELAEEVEQQNVSALIVEPQLPLGAISAFADDHDLVIVTLDPLGGSEGKESYLELMRYNIEQVISILERDE